MQFGPSFFFPLVSCLRFSKQILLMRLGVCFSFHLSIFRVDFLPKNFFSFNFFSYIHASSSHPSSLGFSPSINPWYPCSRLITGIHSSQLKICLFYWLSKEPPVSSIKLMIHTISQ
jgi:hypothetical protein